MTDLIYFCPPKTFSNIEAFLGELTDAGITRLVLAGHMGGMSLLEPSIIAELKGLFHRYKLTTPAIHGLFRNRYDLNSEDPRFLVDAHTRLMDGISELGVKTYVVHCGLPIQKRSREEEWNQIRRALEALLPAAERNDVIIAVENLPPAYIGSDPADLVALVEEFSSAHLRLCFDSGHAHMSGDAADCLRRMSPHVVTMHLHDNDGTSDIHLSPGDGTIDWGGLVLEIHRCPSAIHLEVESFNREGRPHQEMWGLYKTVLGI